MYECYVCGTSTKAKDDMINHINAEHKRSKSVQQTPKPKLDKIGKKFCIWREYLKRKIKNSISISKWKLKSVFWYFEFSRQNGKKSQSYQIFLYSNSYTKIWQKFNFDGKIVDLIFEFSSNFFPLFFSGKTDDRICQKTIPLFRLRCQFFSKSLFE